MKTKFIPAKGTVLIKPFVSETALPSSERNYENIGEVIVSSSKNAKVGDIICFDEYAYRRYNYLEEEYCVVDISSNGTNGGLWGLIRKENGSRKKSL